MLFDLRSRGRRRVVRGVYLGLALLIGLGLVGFGVGTGSGFGGLFTGVSTNSGTATGLKRYEGAVKRAQRAVAASPDNPRRGSPRARGLCAGEHRWQLRDRLGLHELGREAARDCQARLAALPRAGTGEAGRDVRRRRCLGVRRLSGGRWNTPSPKPRRRCWRTRHRRVTRRSQRSPSTPISPASSRAVTSPLLEPRRSPQRAPARRSRASGVAAIGVRRHDSGERHDGDNRFDGLHRGWRHKQLDRRDRYEQQEHIKEVGARASAGACGGRCTARRGSRPARPLAQLAEQGPLSPRLKVRFLHGPSKDPVFAGSLRRKRGTVWFAKYRLPQANESRERHPSA